MAEEFSAWVNSVSVVGRVSTEADFLELPSGQMMARFRVVVPRQAPQTKTTVDTLDCIAYKPVIQRKAEKLAAGQIVELSGEIRRRFWKTGVSVASRVEIEVTALKVLKG